MTWGSHTINPVTDSGLACATSIEVVIYYDKFTVPFPPSPPFPPPSPPLPPAPPAPPPWRPLTSTGPCQVESDGSTECVSSGNYPRYYGNNEQCIITGFIQTPIVVRHFNVHVRHLQRASNRPRHICICPLSTFSIDAFAVLTVLSRSAHRQRPALYRLLGTKGCHRRRGRPDCLEYQRILDQVRLAYLLGYSLSTTINATAATCHATSVPSLWLACRRHSQTNLGSSQSPLRFIWLSACFHSYC